MNRETLQFLISDTRERARGFNGYKGCLRDVPDELPRLLDYRTVGIHGLPQYSPKTYPEAGPGSRAGAIGRRREPTQPTPPSEEQEKSRESYRIETDSLLGLSTTTTIRVLCEAKA